MAGYDGYSKSNNALDAEAEGKYPLTIAVKKLAAVAEVTQKEARRVLKAIGRCEYHHTSKFYNTTDYYDVGEGVIECKNSRRRIIITATVPDWEERIEDGDALGHISEVAISEIVRELDMTDADVRDAYYCEV